MAIKPSEVLAVFDEDEVKKWEAKIDKALIDFYAKSSASMGLEWTVPKEMSQTAKIEIIKRYVAAGWIVKPQRHEDNFRDPDYWTLGFSIR